MALPTDRASFKAYCLNRLGGDQVGATTPLKINVSDTQVEDRIDDALQYWQDYHYDGSEKQYLTHQVTQQDITNKWFTVPDDIIGIVRIFELSSAFGTTNLFSLPYQFAQSDFLSSALQGSMIPYWMAMTHIELVQQILIGKQPIRFNRHRGIIYVDMDWTRVAAGEYIVMEAYQRVDPNEFPDCWQDRWLLRYATALIKKQWGENMKKFEGFRRPDGITFNGQKIWDEAVEEIAKLEDEMLISYSFPVMDLWG